MRFLAVFLSGLYRRSVQLLLALLYRLAMALLSIFEQRAFGGGLGNLWYLSTLASPLAGKFYLDNAERTEQITVKIVTEDDEMTSDIIVQGDDEEVDRFQKTLDMREKGMVYVKGILES